MSNHPNTRALPVGPAEARRQLAYELASGLSGVGLALFMWGHMLLVGSILTGSRGFDWLAGTLEELYIAQPTVAVVVALFLVHAALAARKIPARLRERRQFAQLAGNLRTARGTGDAFRPHLDSWLWIWQVRTAMVILVLGSLHIGLVALDVLTPIFGEHVGIESGTTLTRVQQGLWPWYALLLVCVEFHASVGLYRFAVKWGIGSRLGRPVLKRIEQILFWGILVLGIVTLIVLAGWLRPPLAFLLDANA